MAFAREIHLLGAHLESIFDVLGFRFLLFDAGVFLRDESAHLLDLRPEKLFGFCEAIHLLGAHLESIFDVLGFRFLLFDAGVFLRDESAHLLDPGIESLFGFCEARYFFGPLFCEFGILRV